MSSWYVWAALGLYPEVPGRGELVMGSPLFPHATISLADGQSIVINAPGASPGAPYVQALDVQGLAPSTSPCLAPTGVDTVAQHYNCPWLPASATTTGAQLDFTVGTSPNMQWGSAPQDAPPSFGAG